MLIYAVIVNDVRDASENKMSVELYATHDEAFNYFENVVNEASDYAKKEEWLFDDSNDNTYFCAYSKYGYCADHIEVRIEEKLLNI